MRRLPYALLALALAIGFAFHAYRAEHPTSSYQSADERSYGKLAIDIAENGHYGSPSTGMRDPLHWPPGAPVFFALAHAGFGEDESRRSLDIPAAYWFQALISMGTALAAFGLAWAVAGLWAGVLGAALVALYPPLILATGEQVSEPLGAFLLTTAMCAFALSWRGRSLVGYAIAGVLMGATVLTRADLLFVPFLIAAGALVFEWWRRRERTRGLEIAALLAGGALLAVAPWVIYSSQREGRLVPVTKGSAAPLFVGTYLPGGGHTVGMKRALYDEVVKFRPQLADTPAFEVQASNYMDMLAARHPDLPRDEAIRKEARKNIREYALGDPLEFVVMMGDKVQRMWTRYARGGARHTSWTIRSWHLVLVAMGFSGLLIGIWRGRSIPLAAVLLAALYSTALHLIVISQARYNLPLMPALMAGGVAGWMLWWRARAAARQP